jgi:hypothetical protein
MKRAPLLQVLVPLAAACTCVQTPFVAQRDAGVAAEVAKAMCKLHEGASRTCAAQGSAIGSDGHEVRFEVWIDQEDELLGMVTLEGRVLASVDGKSVPALTTPMRAYGGAREQSIERGVHEWAVVYGSAIVDALHEDADRKAATALSPDLGPAEVGGRKHYPGFALVRGAAGGLERDGLVERLAKLVPADGLHAVGLDRVVDAGGEHLVCRVDGEPGDCEGLEGFLWPSGAGTIIKSYHVFRGPS